MLDKQLMKDEKIIYKAKPHWIIYSKTAFWLIITLILLMVGTHTQVFSNLTIGSIPIFKIVAAITLLVTVLSFISAYVTYFTTDYVTTNRRVLMANGLVRRQIQEILLQRIESISVYQNLLGRILDYGSIVISGTGGSKDPFINIPQPAEFRNRVQEQIGNPHG